MKKNYLILILLILFSLGSKAQLIDFETGTPAGWSTSGAVYTNPCLTGPSGDYFWTDNLSAGPRHLETTAVSKAYNAISFDMVYGNGSV
ncbi:MAG: hypothetical protein HN410_20340 [Prolixibacteraceae bacterium]|jgi:hypothetical protein|nr:hypothetical protein [Prolixibacteraceae bacterium]